MGELTKIQWCHHTFNGWIGCAKVSDGCKFCYASVDTPARVARGQGKELWGPDAARQITSDANWRKPLAWDWAAQKAGAPRRVFTASQSDVFEDREDLHTPRARLFFLVEKTPHLDWLFLTKRPEIAREYAEWFRLTPNAWLGTSVENQAAADERIPVLLSIPARVRFLSMEPLLGPVDLFKVPRPYNAYFAWRGETGAIGSKDEPDDFVYDCKRGIHWVIVGGESGPNARPFDLAWARSIRDQCSAAGVAYFMKQLGPRSSIWCPDLNNPGRGCWMESPLRDPKGGDPDEWPEDLRVREFPVPVVS